MSDGLAAGMIDETSEDAVGRTTTTGKNATPLRAVPDPAPDVPEVHVGQPWALSEERLARLLALRPDLAVPAPASMAELVERSLSAPSIYRALTGADVLVLQLAQILTLIGEKHAAMADVRAMVGDVPAADVKRGLNWLEDRHLVSLLPTSKVCVHVGLLSIRGAGALGPPVAPLLERLAAADLRFILKALGDTSGVTRKADLVDEVLTLVTDQAGVRDLVSGAAPEVRDYAHRVARGSTTIHLPWSIGSDPYRPPGAEASEASVWLLQHGLAYKDTWQTVVMPREVGLALRGGRPFPAASYRRPQVVLQPMAAPAPAPAAAAAEVQVRVAVAVRAVERLIDAWGAKPAALLKNSGVGVREVRRLAGVIDRPERDAFRLIEVAAAAGLIAGDTRRCLAMPTSAGDEWTDLPTADRWWALALSWLETPMYPSLAGATDARNKTVPALGYPANFDSEAAGQRECVLRTVLDLPSGSVAANEALAEVAVWSAPMLWSDVPGTPSVMVGWTRDEMELLGLAVGGVPTPLASALIDGDLGAARTLLADAGDDTWQLVLQTDLTALVTGQAPSSVRSQLELLAEVEGRGSATVYRFSESSVRRAFDTGLSSAEILAFLEGHAAKGVPQPLCYLVGDVERRHGQIRLGRAGCYLRFEDPALAAEVARAKKTSKLGLRQVAPTILVCDQPNEAVLGVLRGAGYLPVVESKDGSVVHAPITRHRTEAPPAPGPAPRSPRSPATQGLATRGHGSGGRSADRWRAQLSGAGAEAGAGLLDTRTLAAALLRNEHGGNAPSSTAGGNAARAGRGVDIPTVLRRPAWELEDPVGLAGEMERLVGDLGDTDGEPGWRPQDDMAMIRELVEWGNRNADDDAGYGDDEPERPTEIFRGPQDIVNVLRLADSHEWLVRLSYTSGSGKSSEVTVLIVVFSDSVILAQAAPRWTDHKYVVDRISWVRVLTDAEEELVS
jgi:hypothetical protein